MGDNDALGRRMKDAYERATQTRLPRKAYTLVRVDGRAFHRYTRGCARPFDTSLMAAMDAAAAALCAEMSGAALAFVQSDEISVLTTDLAAPTAEAWFDGNVQKLCSLTASIATAAFLLARGDGRVAHFDSRVWSMDTADAVADYFRWRQRDAVRNSVSMAARARFTHAETVGVSGDGLKAMLAEIGAPWDELPAGFRRGRWVVPVETEVMREFVHKRTGERSRAVAVRRSWVVEDAPDFDGDPGWAVQIPTPEVVAAAGAAAL